MITGILKESGTENRVAILPAEVAVMKKMGIEVIVELRSGEKAFSSDKDFQASGAVMAERKEVISKAESPVLEGVLKPDIFVLGGIISGKVVAGLLVIIIRSI